MPMGSSSAKYVDHGLLVLRVGIGLCFIIHGLGKFMAGTETLTAVGSAVGNFGISRGYVAFGIAAAGIEVVGGLFVMAGLLFRWSCLALVAMLVVALTMHLKDHDPFSVYSQALECLILFLSLSIIGPGKFSVDKG